MTKMEDWKTEERDDVYLFFFKYREHKLAFGLKDNYQHPAESDVRRLTLYRVIRTSAGGNCCSLPLRFLQFSLINIIFRCPKGNVHAEA